MTDQKTTYTSPFDLLDQPYLRVSMDKLPCDIATSLARTLRAVDVTDGAGMLSHTVEVVNGKETHALTVTARGDNARLLIDILNQGWDAPNEDLMAIIDAVKDLPPLTEEQKASITEGLDFGDEADPIELDDEKPGMFQNWGQVARTTGLAFACWVLLVCAVTGANELVQAALR